MKFQEFLEQSEAKFRRGILEADRIPFSKTHIFNLGEDEKIEESIHEIWEDLKDDMTEKVPLPFMDTTCISMVKSGWILDRIVELPVTAEERQLFSDAQPPENATESQKAAMRGGPKQKLSIMRIEQGNPDVISWCCFFYGVMDRGIILSALPTQDMYRQFGDYSATPGFMNWIENESRAVVKQVAAISHPGNYIVEVRPDLTPHEARRVAAGKARPVAKSPHYIVLDQEMLVRISKKEKVGTHASPVPHHRRGHWMRLAARCKHARMMGKEKVFVREAFVGEPQFSDEKNQYLVLLGFSPENKKREMAEGLA